MPDDPNQAERLRQRYAQMPDGELQAIAADAQDLTEEARSLIAEEVRRRGIGSSPEPVASGHYELEYQPWVTVATFMSMHEALLVKASLESAGMVSRLADEYLLGEYWLSSIALGGARVQVKVQDEAAAREILKQPIPRNIDDPELGEYEQPHCPICGSLNIGFKGNSAGAAVIPYPLRNRAWKCENCSIEWEDVPEAETGTPPVEKS